MSADLSPEERAREIWAQLYIQDSVVDEDEETGPAQIAAALIAAENAAFERARKEIRDAVVELEAPRNAPQYGEIRDVIDAARIGVLREYLDSRDGDLDRIVRGRACPSCEKLFESTARYLGHITGASCRRLKTETPK